MNKTLIIFRHEILNLVRSVSFWFGALGVPLLGLLLVTGISAINRSQGGDNAVNPLGNMQSIFTPPEDQRPQGFIDQAGLIEHYPADFRKSTLIRYADSAAARADLDAGKIGGYFVIPADYVRSGKLLHYTQDYNLVASEQRSSPLRTLIDYNLLKGNEPLITAIDNPLAHMTEQNLSPEPGKSRDTESEFNFFIPYGVMMLFFISIMGSASLLLNNIAKEKENRIMEVLMVSATPHQLLLGKIGGLGLVGLFQVAIWGASAVLLTRMSGQASLMPADFQLEPSLIGWGLVFFVLGFLVYASLMAGVGALVPNLREASQATFMIMLPLMIPLFVLSALIEAPNGALAVALSLFPFTAPTCMMMRLAATQVPLWQILTAIALLAVTALLVVRMVAGMFRAQTIMSGQPFNIKRLVLALAGRG